MFKNALVSVSDKTGLLEFLKPLVSEGLRVVSTGGTYKYLKDNQIPVVDIQEQTGFPEVMDGRVKTLHPRVHMPLLARADHPEDMGILKREGLEPFDLILVNLYPFEASFGQKLDESEMIEKIDIGGPSLLRAAAKNFSRVTVVCDPADYSALLDKRNRLTLSDRKKLAAKVFSHVSRYDSLIAHWMFSGEAIHLPAGETEREYSVGGNLELNLRYGENPHQRAQWYSLSGKKTEGLHAAKIIQGKVLSYNNILDLEAATALIQSYVNSTAVGVKHNNPCGVASGPNLVEATRKMIKSDPVSIFGGIVALNERCDGSVAELLSSIFLECVIAPGFNSAALGVFAAKKNLRLLEWPEMMKVERKLEMKSICGGLLLQESDDFSSDPQTWKGVCGVDRVDAIPLHILKDLVFAEKVCASLKSNAIAIVKDEQTLGLGMGQVNRVEAVAHAITRLKSHHGALKNLVLASDAFFPFPDSLLIAAEGGVEWILQPGGSVKDEEVIREAIRLGIKMIFTGKRHFRH